MEILKLKSFCLRPLDHVPGTAPDTAFILLSGPVVGSQGYPGLLRCGGLDHEGRTADAVPRKSCDHWSLGPPPS